MCFWSDPDTAKYLETHDPLLSMELFEKTLEQTLPYFNKFGLADGGEFMMDPFWKERLVAIAEKCRENPDLMFHQTTNASLLTKKNIKYMKGIRNAFFVLSIDSLDPLNYADIRRPGKLGSVLFNIRNLRDNLAEVGVTNVTIQISMVLMKRNIFEVPNMIRFAKEIGANLSIDHMQGMFGPIQMDNQSLFHYPAFANKYIAYCRSIAKTMKVSMFSPAPFAVTDTEIDSYYNAKKSKSLHCTSLDEWGPISVHANGNVTVCCNELVFGNLNEETFETIYFSEKYDFYRNGIRSASPPEPCNSCRFLHYKMPYLYESSAYDLDVPPSSRNLDPNPDFKKEGFYDWLNEISSRSIRHHLVHSMNYENNRQLESNDFIQSQNDFFQTQKVNSTVNDKLKKIIDDQSKVIIYPAGSRARDLLNTTSLSSCNIIAFSDIDPMKHLSQFYGYNVIPPDSIQNLKPDAVLIACSDLYEEEILSELSYLNKLGIEVISI